MDFPYPQEAEQFRKELRSWLSLHLTADVFTWEYDPHPNPGDC